MNCPDYIIENVKFVLGTEKLIFVKTDWIYSDPITGGLTLNEKINNIDGILIFGISVQQSGTGAPLAIIDQKRVSHIVFEGYDAIPGINSFGQFFYYVDDNRLNFLCSVPTVFYGFNYVTIRKG